MGEQENLRLRAEGCQAAQRDGRSQVVEVEQHVVEDDRHGPSLLHGLFEGRETQREVQLVARAVGELLDELAPAAGLDHREARSAPGVRRRDPLIAIIGELAEDHRCAPKERVLVLFAVPGDRDGREVMGEDQARVARRGLEDPSSRLLGTRRGV